MPPWKGTEARRFMCVSCASEFWAKRPAKFCSESCRARERSKTRPHDPKYRQLYDKRRRAHKGDLLRAQERARRDAVQEFLRAAKLERGCMDCGYAAHHAALEAVHSGTGKALTLSTVKTLAKAQSGMEQAEVLCANCHRIRSFDRLKTIEGSVR